MGCTADGGVSTGSGGARASTGGAGTGGPGTGGRVISSSGGRPASGGAPSSGGASATGGASSGGSGSGGTGDSDGGASTDGPAGTGGAGGTTPGCAAPVDPSATTQTKNLLCYLYSIYGSKVLSGQQETSWSNPQGDIDYYVSTVGKHPAILGGDYLYKNGTTSRAQAYWNAGGITVMRYHMGAPPSADTYDNAKATVSNFDDLTKAGTSLNSSLNSKLDYLAGELKTLQDAKVPVILVIYHEVDKFAWFWWSKGTGAQFNTLWKYTVDYINKTKGIHNVIWALGFGHDGALAAYYPGKAYVDLGGIDEYDKGTQPFSNQYDGTKGVFGETMPIPLHETGTIPQPKDMFPKAPWLMWNVWATYENTNAEGYTWNTAATIKAAYADSHTITREALPSLK
ncbi:MAG: glycosyl hydrolase [Myxococcales bacterium]